MHHEKDIEDKSIIKSIGNGAVLAAQDLWSVVTNPAGSIKALAGFINDLSTVVVGTHDPVAEENINNIKENIKNKFRGSMNADRYQNTEDASRFAFGGMGAGWGVSKGVQLVKNLKTPKTIVKVSGQPPLDRNLYFLDLHTKYIRKASNNELKRAALSSEDMFEAIAKASAPKTLSPLNPYGFALETGIYGASDRPKSESGGFSFFNEARGEERPSQADKNEQMSAHQLKTFAKAYGFTLDEIDSKTQDSLREILQKQEASNHLYEFADRLNAAKSTFNDIRNIGIELNHKGLFQAGDIGLKALNLGDATLKLQDAIPAIKTLTDPNGPIGQALSFISSLNPYVAIASAAIQLGCAIFGREQEDPFRKMVIEYMQAILKYMGIFRSEMHQRFDHVDYRFDKVFERFDVLQSALKGILAANLELGLKGNIHIESILENKVIPALQTIASDISELRLDGLNQIMVEIAAHRDKKINKEDIKTKLDELLSLDRNLVNNWLRGILLSESQNGASKVTPQNLPDPSVIFHSLSMNRIELGLLERFARYHLNMFESLSSVQSNKIPQLNFWPQAMQAHIAAQMTAAHVYGGKMNVEATRELKAITKNTGDLIEVFSQNWSEILTTLINRYTDALKLIQVSLERKTQNQIRSCDYKFTLRQAFDLGLLEKSLQAPTQFDKFLEGQKSSKYPTLPSNLFIAEKLGIIKINANEAFYKVKGESVHLLRDDGQDYFKYIYNQFQYQFNITMNRDNFFTLDAKYSHPDRYANNRKKHYQAMMDGHNKACTQQYNLPNSTLISYCSPTHFGIAESIKRDIDSEYSTAIAKKIIKHKQSEDCLDSELLEGFIDQYYAEAIDALILDRSSYAAHEQSMKLILGLALAYGRAVNLDPSLLIKIQQHMSLDIRRIFSEPGLYQKSLDLALTLDDVINARPDATTNPITVQMKASEITVNSFEALSLLHEGYLKNINQWNHDLDYYHEITLHLSQMKQLTFDGFEFFDKQTVSNLAHNLHSQKQEFEKSYRTLLDMYNQLQTYGFPVLPPKGFTEAFEVTDMADGIRPRRGVGLPDLSKVTLIELIEKSGNPYLDATQYLEGRDVQSAVGHVRTLDSTGKSPLHHAALLGDQDLIELLMKYDAPIALKDHSGKTAVEYLPKSAKESRTLLRFWLWLQSQENRLGYSLSQAIPALREELELMKLLEENDTPTVEFEGETGDGKSAFISFMAGTDYKLISISRHEKDLVPTNEVKEVAPRGKLKSETRSVKLIPLFGLHFIDKAGDNDTGGNLRNMIKDFINSVLHRTQKVTKAKISLISDALIFSDKMVAVRQQLTKIGRRIKNDPERLIKHILLVVSKPDLEILSNSYRGDPTGYEKSVFQRLMALKDSLGVVPQGHPDYDMYCVLNLLSLDNIFLGDLTHPNTRVRLRDRLNAIPVTPSEDFNTIDLKDHAESFNEVMSTVVDGLQSTYTKIRRMVGMLGQHWKNELTLPPYHRENLGELVDDPNLALLKMHEEAFSNIHEDLMGISKRLIDATKSLADSPRGLIGDVSSISEELSELIREVEQQKILITELGDLSLQMGLPVAEEIQKLVAKAKPAPTQTELRIDGTTDCYELESARFYSCALPFAQETFTLPEDEEYFEAIDWEEQTGFSDKINDYLIVGRYIGYYLGYLNPANWARTPSKAEIQTLESALAQLRTYKQPIARLVRSALNTPALYNDQITAIINNTDHLKQMITGMISSNSLSSSILSEIEHKLQRTQGMITELTDLNKELNRLRGKLGADERVVIGHDWISNKLTLSLEPIPEVTPLRDISFFNSAPNRTFTPTWNISQPSPIHSAPINTAQLSNGRCMSKRK
jgi:hypothetical protein